MMGLRRFKLGDVLFILFLVFALGSVFFFSVLIIRSGNNKEASIRQYKQINEYKLEIKDQAWHKALADSIQIHGCLTSGEFDRLDELRVTAIKKNELLKLSK